MSDQTRTQREPLTLQEMTDAAKKRVSVAANELSNGFEFLRNYPKSVTFFGSARITEGHMYYEKARRLASKIVEKLHYTVITGGGPGIMQAANRGAYEAGGNSVGITIELPNEQKTNEYLTDHLSFHYFFTRKVCLSFSAESYIFFPGGFGTLDEFTEILTLVQTKKIPKAPIILVGREYWMQFERFLNLALKSQGYIDSADTGLYIITDNEDEIVEIVRNAPLSIGVEFNHKNNGRGTEDTISAHPLSELSEKHCVPCEGGTLPLSHEESQKYLKEVNQWTLVEDKGIEKTYEFQDFEEAIEFMNNVARIAETEGHHPDLKLHDFKKVDVRISTHAINGLSENDFILASKIDDLLR